MKTMFSTLGAVLVLLGSAQAFLTPNMQATVLREHNEARSRVRPTAANMERMVWNPTLALIAQEYAENCVWEPNDMRHSEAEHLFPMGVGENMALNYGSSAIINQNPAQFIKEWVDEGYYYNITFNTCEPGRICDHYTQLMTANTVAVGCGFHVCQEFEFFGATLPLAAFFICNYGPQGQAVTNQMRPYVQGLPCSMCPIGRQLCSNNLCELGMARAPPAIAYPTNPLPIVTTRAPTRLPASEPVTLPPATQPVANIRVHTSQVGIVNTDIPTTPTPLAGATEPATAAAAITAGLINTEVNCTSPVTVLERETCWLHAWSDWRRKFDTWVHTNCPGP